MLQSALIIGLLAPLITCLTTPAGPVALKTVLPASPPFVEMARPGMSAIKVMEGVWGRNATMTCEEDNTDSFTAKKSGCWSHKGKEIYCSEKADLTSRLTNRLIYGKISPSSLTINNLQDDDAGIYMCCSDEYRCVKISLVVKNVSISQPVASINTELLVLAGTRVQLTCHSSSGSMPIQYHWYHQDPSLGTYSMVNSDATLVFDPCKPENSGQYQCSASNLISNQTSNVLNFTVEEHLSIPYVDADPKELFVFEGQAVTLWCKVTAGSPPIIWTWYRVKENRLEIVSSQQELKLDRVQDSGPYYCQANNSVRGMAQGQTSEKHSIHIVPKPVEFALAEAALALVLLCCVTALILVIVWLLIWKKKAALSKPLDGTQHPVSAKAQKNNYGTQVTAGDKKGNYGPQVMAGRKNRQLKPPVRMDYENSGDIYTNLTPNMIQDENTYHTLS
ncbi:Fc receptor-like protein 5 isoform X1 [Acipenser ruthenus]|uniref:Fc receptor-like protein 5 isoform X1 n=1 Tax=Acipenser ruthenus TaxID=7906 RepID=UPI0027403EB8|nr:Fc receptor-like protein 5 isoform X1 [Acipenser ruthenus]